MPSVMSNDDVLRLAHERHVSFILLQFTDILGVAKAVTIPIDQLEKALNRELMFDGSSIHGFVRIEESDMYLWPDPDTFAILPWLGNGDGAVARLICDVADPEGNPFEGDPRFVLKKVCAQAAAEGYTFMTGPEAEFFLFLRNPDGTPSTATHDQASYFDLAPIDAGELARREMVVALQSMGFEVERSSHEVAPGQHEIDFRYAEAVTTADRLMTFKLVVKSIAHRHGLHATFMPKPIYGVNGSGMHVHQSLFRGDKNAFYDPSAPYQLSRTAMHFLAGLLAHARAITAVCNPTVNSYKRLVPGYEAPVYIAWSQRNRSPLVRVPAKRGQSTRFELRSPDPAANPYLAMAVMLAAGIDGIKRGLVPPDPVDRNIFEMTPRERAEARIDSLPGSLEEALDALAEDEVIKAALGEHVFTHFMEAKRIEWDVYRKQVHPWELEQYISVL